MSSLTPDSKGQANPDAGETVKIAKQVAHTENYVTKGKLSIASVLLDFIETKVLP
ncbi:MAG: hypothetical protein ACI8VI_001343, partial [Granulosicoccus sp.]